MIRRAMTVSTVLLTIAAAATASAADDAAKKGPNAGSKPAAAASTSNPVDDAAAALKLAAWGRANKSPEALIAAAQLLSASGVTAGDAKKTSEANADKPADAKAPAKAKGAAPAHDASGLLAEASTLAKSQKKDALAKDADAVLAKLPAATRGATNGARENFDEVNAYSTDVYTISFDANEPAAVGLSGDGSTDLDLYVYDQNGNLICTSNGAGDDEACSWTPVWTGPFKIQVKNVGGVENYYAIVTN